MVRVKQTAKPMRSRKVTRSTETVPLDQSPPPSPPRIKGAAAMNDVKKTKKIQKSNSPRPNDSVSRARLKILWMIEFILDSENVPWSLKIEYLKIAARQLNEDDSSLGMPRVLYIRMLLEEMKFVCGEDGANWDWQERSLKLYPILLKILYIMDLKGEEKLDERMRPHKKIMALAFVSHMVQLGIERQFNEFKRVWDSQVYAELKETPQGQMVRDELEWLDKLGESLLGFEHILRVNGNKTIDLDTYGGDGPLSPGKQLQDNLNSTDQPVWSDEEGKITGARFERSVNELLKELKAYYKRAKMALGPTFLQEASMDILHEKYSPNLDDNKILIRTDEDLERNLESIGGGRESEDDSDGDDSFEQTPNRIVTPKNVIIFAKGSKKRPVDATAKNNDNAERQPQIFKKIKIKMDGRKGGKTVNARDIQFDTEVQYDDPYEFHGDDQVGQQKEEDEEGEEESEEEEEEEGEEEEEEEEEETQEKAVAKKLRDDKFFAWGDYHDERLLDGVEKYGYGKWKKIVQDKALHKGHFTGLGFDDLRYKHKRIMMRAGAKGNALLLPRKTLVALYTKKAPKASIANVTRLEMAKAIDDQEAVLKALDEEGWDFSGRTKERAPQQSPLQKLRDGAVHVLERLVGRRIVDEEEQEDEEGEEDEEEEEEEDDDA